jgi:hypothetical protein
MGDQEKPRNYTPTLKPLIRIAQPQLRVWDVKHVHEGMQGE